MTSITIENLDDDIAIILQRRAKDSGRSPEEEVKEILRTVLTKNTDAPLNLAAAIEQRFASFGDFEIPAVVREPLREPPQF
ncbi:MAG: plasmid stability protein [Cyanobacteriota bacterium]|nr:plasmid stability protein [Cyanobacteriota bacterium]